MVLALDKAIDLVVCAPNVFIGLRTYVTTLLEIWTLGGYLASPVVVASLRKWPQWLMTLHHNTRRAGPGSSWA